MRSRPVIAKCVAPIPLLIVLTWIDCYAQKSTLATAPREQTTVDSFAGCYELTLGRWWPWGFGSDDTFFTPPRRIKLLTEPGTKGWEEKGLLLRALPDPAPTRTGRRGPSYWNVLSPNQIELTWTDGFTGITIKLNRTGNELRGWVHPHSDAAMFIHHSAHVTARLIYCGMTK
jgi:hypothetical protein